MKKFPHLLLSIITAVLAVFVTPSPQADPPELDCTDVPCAAPQLVALPPDSPDGGDYSTTGQPAIELAETGATRLVIEFPLGIDTVAAALATTA